MMKDANYWIEHLSLIKHPEGGFYKETIRSREVIVTNAGDHEEAQRSLYTSIYFLLLSENFSAWHRIKSDEIWHWHAGNSLSVFVINKNGELKTIHIGNDLEHGETLQAVVQAGCWFASDVNKNNTFSLVSCTVIPGFSFDDFELATSQKLIEEYPFHSKIIKKYCRI